jgi:hypothetical protein
MDWYNRYETIRNESIIGLGTWGGPETMTP